MRNSIKITFSALMAALAAVVMLASYFPYTTYAVPAIAGMFVMLVAMEVDLPWACACYCTAAAVTLLFAEPEAKLLFLGLFGYYPIVKALTERLKNRGLEWVLKLAVFNAAMLLVYAVFALIVDLRVEEFSVLGRYGAWIFLVVGNGVFVLYDIALSRMAGLYWARLHPTVSRLLSRK